MISDPAQVRDLSASLMNTARRDWMTLENLHTEMPLTADFAQPPLPAFGDRVRCRSSYAAAMMDDPVARQNIQACVEAGGGGSPPPAGPDEAEASGPGHRTAPSRPGRHRRHGHPRPGHPGRAPRVLRAPLKPRHPARRTAPEARHRPADPGQKKVLELMGLGDDANASCLAVSTSTVRRHITAVAARLGVSSRFAMGAAAKYEAGLALLITHGDGRGHLGGRGEQPHNSPTSTGPGSTPRESHEYTGTQRHMSARPVK